MIRSVGGQPVVCQASTEGVNGTSAGTGWSWPVDSGLQADDTYTSGIVSSTMEHYQAYRANPHLVPASDASLSEKIVWLAANGYGVMVTPQGINILHVSMDPGPVNAGTLRKAFPAYDLQEKVDRDSGRTKYFLTLKKAQSA